MSDYFLGIDGGQSHTTALIADAAGNVLGRGRGGESNHTRAPGGRARLEQALIRSVSEALRKAGLLESGLEFAAKKRAIRDFSFASAHLAMTGEPEDKVAIVRTLLRAKYLKVGHDAPGALAGALPEMEASIARVIVLAGTGSVAVGEKGRRQVRIGGRGYLFSDEGSAFAIAREVIALALRAEDRGVKQDVIRESLLEFFQRASLKDIAEDYYAGLITRERLAAFTTHMDRLARNGSQDAVALLQKAATQLGSLAQTAAMRLGGKRADVLPILISYGGGVFRSRLLFAAFSKWIRTVLPAAEIRRPRFGPETGALLLAYRQSGIRITEALLENVTGKN